MNIFTALFGIFRQRGLVNTVKEGKSLAGFTLSAIFFAILGGLLYGFAMGVGLGVQTALKDAIKVGLVVTLSLFISLPIFWVAYRLLGREERPGQVSAVPLTLVATVAVIMVVTAPIVFLLSVLAGFSPEGVYIHIIIVDLALLIGLYLAGTLLFYGFGDHRRLIIPNVVGFLMQAVILVVLILFFGPFLALRPTFSVGTDRLKDGLGIGVAEKVQAALAAAASADRVTYRFQTTNDNGDLLRDYTVTRAENDYLIEVHLHAVPGETTRSQQRIWLLDSQLYTDFAAGRVTMATRAELVGILDPALPPVPFNLPPEFAFASWRAYESAGVFTANGNTPGQQQVIAELDAATGRLTGLRLGSATRGPHAEVRVSEFGPASFDRSAMQASLNVAKVLGSVDRSDASLQDYVQEQAFFVVRIPRNWRVRNQWDSTRRLVEFTWDCGAPEGCPALAVTVYDLAEGKGPQQYAEDLGRSLGQQPEYREVRVSTVTIGGQTAGVVEYLFDRTVKGQIETTHHIEYLFAGQLSRYHLDFTAPEKQFETNRGSFEAIAAGFTYLN